VANKEKTIDRRITPAIVFGVLLLLIVLLSFYELKTEVHFYSVDFLLLLIGGLLGTLFFVLSIFTEHTTTAWNLNLIWAWPTHLLMAFVLLFAKKKQWVKNYFLIAAICCLVMVVGWKLLPQQFLLANIFIAAIYGLRGYSIYKS
jgi:uncharacterized membrane protein (UPF0136 family)